MIVLFKKTTMKMGGQPPSPHRPWAPSPTACCPCPWPSRPDQKWQKNGNFIDFTIQWIGLRENLQESPIFNGTIYGFL